MQIYLDKVNWWTLLIGFIITIIYFFLLDVIYCGHWCGNGHLVFRVMAKAEMIKFWKVKCEFKSINAKN